MFELPLESLHAKDIYNVAVSAVEPQHMIRKAVQYDADKAILTVQEKKYELNHNVYVVGFGKAVLGMGGGSFLIPSPRPPISLEDLIVMTKELENNGASAKDINIVRKNVEFLKSGGLVTAARPAKLVSFIISDIIGDPLGMISSGPTVYDQVTSHQCFEIFNRLNVISKIPQTILAHLQQQVTNEITKAMLMKRKPLSSSSISTKDLEDPQVSDAARIQNVIVGSNRIACQAAERHAQHLGYLPFILSTELEGEARRIGAMFGKLGIYTLMCFNRRLWNRAYSPFVHLELEIVKEGINKSQLNAIANLVERAQNLGKSIVIIAGGESVVNVVGTGKGGQNQELALAAAIELHKSYNLIDPRSQADITLLSSDTDGEDGPWCQAAGAVIDQNFVRNAEAEGASCLDSLENNDSNTLLSMVNGGAHLVVTHMTGTKVMDIQVLIVCNPAHTK
ncbi:hypothetical protein C0Q70_15007 [Pomacea canaliculata]|uniref:Glycerate kinase n=1 Tax=Pomacea canaliculata TaxID=400727 RepID=A0A2T7NTP2_POMCA|nr:hypothetical protein C0Q70_15007 [Pomacea canaliculata]